MTLTVKTQPEFAPGKPEILFRVSLLSSSLAWDISPDGGRFLIVMPAGFSIEKPAAEKPKTINIVLNWFEELKQRVPIK